MYAVSIASFRDIRFPVIDSIWESEIQRLPGKLKFMVAIQQKKKIFIRAEREAVYPATQPCVMI
jgi:hypothetical protein